MNDQLNKTLNELGLSELLSLFEAQDIDDSVLADLSDVDLKDIGIDKLGTRKKLLAAFGSVGGRASSLSVDQESSDVRSTTGALPKNVMTPAEATKDSPWVNTLGMPFVPVPRFDTRFCIWPVRVQDYEAYCMASGASYPKTDFKQDLDHPISCVSWNDAIEFCVWLTGKERSEGKIDDKTLYRLPTDLEWSAAVGLPHEPEATPAERSEQAPGYPWGLRWPPPKGAGNYAQTLEVDSFEHTSPVESFSANAFGLHDMGGNVWEWCMDWLDPNEKFLRVIRGAAWCDRFDSFLLSSFRRPYGGPDYHSGIYGFRCVLVGESSR